MWLSSRETKESVIYLRSTTSRFSRRGVGGSNRCGRPTGLEMDVDTLAVTGFAGSHFFGWREQSGFRTPASGLRLERPDGLGRIHHGIRFRADETLKVGFHGR